MLSRAVNSYAASAVEDALHFVTGSRQMLFKYELFDERNNKLRDVDVSVLGGAVKWNFNSQIRRTAQFDILEIPLSLDTYANTVKQDRPIGYWRLGELSGTSAADQSGNGLNGTYNNVTLGAAGTLIGDNNAAGLFNGSTSYVSIPFNSALNFTNFTIKARIKTTSTAFQQIVDRDNVSTTKNWQFRMLTDGTLEFVAYFTSAPTTPIVFNSGVKINDGETHEVAVSYDQTAGLLRLWADGQIMKEFAETRTLVNNQTSNINIGRSIADGAYFNGTIDEVAFYGYALGPAQMRLHAQAANRDTSEINYNTDRLKPWAGVVMLDGGTAWFPLGLFLLSTSPRVADETSSVYRTVEAYDQTQVLIDDALTDRLTIPAGTNYITAISQQLTAAGIPAAFQNLSLTTKTLPQDRDWDIGTSRIQVINDLLDAINYFSLWFDENGVAQAIPYLAPTDAPSEYVYQDDQRNVILPGIEQTLETFGVPNVWVIYTSEPEGAILRAEVQNDRLTSPTSIPRRGRKIVRPPELVEAADQATLDAKANRLKIEASQVYEQVTLTTPGMPFHGGNRDCYTLVYSDLGLSAKYAETEWEFPLNANGEMTHRLKRVVYV